MNHRQLSWFLFCGITPNFCPLLHTICRNMTRICIFFFVNMSLLSLHFINTCNWIFFFHFFRYIINKFHIHNILQKNVQTFNYQNYCVLSGNTDQRRHCYLNQFMDGIFLIFLIGTITFPHAEKSTREPERTKNQRMSWTELDQFISNVNTQARQA